MYSSLSLKNNYNLHFKTSLHFHQTFSLNAWNPVFLLLKSFYAPTLSNTKPTETSWWQQRRRGSVAAPTPTRSTRGGWSFPTLWRLAGRLLNAGLPPPTRCSTAKCCLETTRSCGSTVERLDNVLNFRYGRKSILNL